MNNKLRQIDSVYVGIVFNHVDKRGKKPKHSTKEVLEIFEKNTKSTTGVYALLVDVDTKKEEVISYRHLKRILNREGKRS